MGRTVKSAEKILEIGKYFLETRPKKNNIAKGIFEKGVSLHPESIELVHYKGVLSENSSIFLQDLSRCIEFNPNNLALRFERMGLYEDLGDIAKMKTEAKQILDSPMAKNLCKEEKDFLLSLVNDNKVAISSNPARVLKPQVLSKEQQMFNDKINELWNTHNIELEELFNEVRTTTKSTLDVTPVTMSIKDKLLGSILKVGKPEEFGLQYGQTLYHGTSSEAKSLIETYGFDLSKCKRMESGKGVYLGFDKNAAGIYGGSVVETRFCGSNIAEISPCVFKSIHEDTLLKFSIANILKLDIFKEEDIKIVDEIISKYYNSILETKNISALYCRGSLNASCSYLVVPNPSKAIEIL